MSTLRPSRRDDLEKLYLAKIAEALDIQRQLDGVEAPRMPVKGDGEPKDGLDSVSPARLATAPELPEDGDSPDVDDIMDENEGCQPDQTDAFWMERNIRVSALCAGVLRMIKDPRTKHPKLQANIALFSLGIGVDSMRSVAIAYGITVERVSQMTEAMRRRFNLPKNQHNKSEAAILSYRKSAATFNERKNESNNDNA